MMNDKFSRTYIGDNGKTCTYAKKTSANVVFLSDKDLVCKHVASSKFVVDQQKLLMWVVFAARHS